jgi:amino acid adenylation domain-containing protein
VQSLGVGPEVLVGVCLERSPELIIALLAILKAGGAFVPLDPSYPLERLSFMVTDAQLSLLLTTQMLAERLQFQHLPTLCLDTLAAKLALQPVHAPYNTATHHSLAYLIYTSGSTGRPKGVMIEHLGLVNLCQDQIRTLSLSPHSRVLQFASFSFDASVYEIFNALLAGAALCLVPSVSGLSATDFLALLRRQAITMVTLPPSFLAILPATPLPALQTIVTAGEELPTELAVRWGQDHAIFNGYGPTEATVCASIGCYPNDGRKPSIGRELTNVQIYILDQTRQLVPIGVPGEIYIGGMGVARGYLNRPELTSERFIPDPFSGQSGLRLYRSGDLARRLSNGEIEFLGRVDQQIKLRGFRIELGEIEEALRAHPDLQEAVVKVNERISGEKRLVAYFVTKAGASLTSAQLRQFLKDRLPDYMQPSFFQRLERMPITVNGKIDRRALPEVTPLCDEQKENLVLPSTDLERLLVQIWSDILQIPLGIQSNFFDLGGHSLLATQLIARMSNELKKELPIASLFRYPTIAQLAASLQKLDNDLANQVPVIPSCTASSSMQEQREHKQAQQERSPFLLQAERPLLQLIFTGQQPPVDAVILGYVSPAMFKHLSQAEVIADLFDSSPALTGILETAWGRIGIMYLPIFDQSLFTDQEAVLKYCLEACQIAGQIGAKVVSLGHQLPAATDLGKMVHIRQAPDLKLPAISTGHGTIVSAIVLKIQRMLDEATRNLRQERVGFLGVGPIGRAAMELMLVSLPHPQELLICDLYASPQALVEIEQAVRQLDFQGTITLLPAAGKDLDLPDAFYTSSLVIGTTNVPDILNVARLAPGTLLIDDTLPHAFSVPQAINRLESRGDLLFSEGRMLQLPQPGKRLSYLPPRWEKAMTEQALRQFQAHDPLLMPGCIVSCMLTGHSSDLPPTIGAIEHATSMNYYRHLLDLGFVAAPLACDGYTLPAPRLARFREQFGHTSSLVESRHSRKQS